MARAATARLPWRFELKEGELNFPMGPFSDLQHLPPAFFRDLTEPSEMRLPLPSPRIIFRHFRGIRFKYQSASPACKLLCCLIPLLIVFAWTILRENKGRLQNLLQVQVDNIFIDTAVDNGGLAEHCHCQGDGGPSAWMQAETAIKRKNAWLTCPDPRAISHGPGQRVISYNIFQGLERQPGLDFIRMLESNAKAWSEFYPGWLVRVYHNYPSGSPACKSLCTLREQHRVISLCHIQDLPRFPEGLQRAIGSTWRFLPMADDQVDAFVSRDADTLVNAREAAAVQEWLASGKTLHTMHDYQEHGAEIMAGMWGTNIAGGAIGEVKKKRKVLQSLAVEMMRLAIELQVHKQLDQRILREVLWNHFVGTDDYINHAAYFCYQFGFKSVPFPRQRQMSPPETRFVGAYMYKELP